MAQQVLIRVNRTVPDALADCAVHFSPAGQAALDLTTHRQQLAAAHGGLTDGDIEWLTEECERLGFSEVWTKFVLGVQ